MASKISSRLSGGKPAKVQDEGEDGRPVPGTTKVASTSDKHKAPSSNIGDRVSDSGRTGVTYSTLASADSAKVMPILDHTPKAKAASSKDSSNADLTPVPTGRAPPVTDKGKAASPPLSSGRAASPPRAYYAHRPHEPRPYSHYDQSYPYSASYGHYAPSPYPPSYDSHYPDPYYATPEQTYIPQYDYAEALPTRPARTSRPRPMSYHDLYAQDPSRSAAYHEQDYYDISSPYSQEPFFVMDRPRAPPRTMPQSSSRRAIVPAQDGRPAMVHAHTDTRPVRPLSYIDPSRSSRRGRTISYDAELPYEPASSSRSSAPSSALASSGRRRSSRSTRYSISDAGFAVPHSYDENHMAMRTPYAHRPPSTRQAFVDQGSDVPSTTHSRRHSVAVTPTTASTSRSRRYSASPGVTTISESRSGRKTAYLSGEERDYLLRRGSKSKRATRDGEEDIGRKASDAQAYMQESGAPASDDLATAFHRSYSQKSKRAAIDGAAPSIVSRQSGRSHRSRTSHTRTSHDASSTSSNMIFRVSDDVSGKVTDYSLPLGARVEILHAESSTHSEPRRTERDDRQRPRERSIDRDERRRERGQSTTSSIRSFFSRRGSRDHTPSDGGSDARHHPRNARISSPIIEDRFGERREESRR